MRCTSTLRRKSQTRCPALRLALRPAPELRAPKAIRLQRVHNRHALFSAARLGRTSKHAVLPRQQRVFENSSTKSVETNAL